MDNSLGKHVACVAAYLAATVVLLWSPAYVRADKDDSQADDSQAISRSVDFAQHTETVPAVEVPAAEIEGMVEIPDTPAEIPLPTAEPPVLEDAVGTAVGDEIIADDVVDSYDSAIAVTPSWGAAGPAPVYSTGSWFSAGRWYTQLDAVVLTKDNRSERRIAFDSSSPTTVAGPQNVQFEHTMTTRMEQFDYQLGARATIGRFLGRDAANRDHLWEFTYFGGFDWRAKSNIAMPSFIQTALRVSDDLPASGLIDQLVNQPPFPGFNNTDRQTYRYDSDLNSFELNYRIKTRPGRDRMALHPSGVWTRHESSSQIRSFLAGARAMSINEGFLNEALVAEGEDAFRLTGMYRVRTDNNMFGPQIGLEIIELHDRWHCGFRGYLGGLANFADRRSFLFTDIDTPQGNEVTERSQKLTENQLTFFSQVGLYGALHLRPNLSVRAGYDFIYMSGLGIAIDNLFIGDNFNGFSTAGVALYHGLSIGVEQTW